MDANVSNPLFYNFNSFGLQKQNIFFTQYNLKSCYLKKYLLQSPQDLCFHTSIGGGCPLDRRLVLKLQHCIAVNILHGLLCWKSCALFSGSFSLYFNCWLRKLTYYNLFSNICFILVIQYYVFVNIVEFNQRNCTK